ncbi:Phospholipase/Carboxylesterase-like protein 3 [Elsinoe fawcettii]|nr:Phospholipase/Carboxylesterase-like protein 3 [Elsinoe fawcettii]
MSAPTTTHTVAPLAEHTHTIIFLHGRDSTATEFAAEIFESQGSDDLTLQQALPGVKWVFPSAPVTASARFGCDMSQWFDTWDVQKPEERWEEQVEGLSRSVREVVGLIEREVEVVGKERVLVAGMSQGAAVAGHAVLRTEATGFVGLSTWFALGEVVGRVVEPVGDIEKKMVEVVELTGGSVNSVVVGKEMKVFLGHCEDDEVVPFANGEKAKDIWTGLGAEVEWRRYRDGGHWLNEPQGVDDLVAFVKRTFAIK